LNALQVAAIDQHGDGVIQSVCSEARQLRKDASGRVRVSRNSCEHAQDQRGVSINLC
jgi:hypothetical protein